jgi:hypothetical protein
MLTRMAGEKPRRPQFVRIAEFFGLAADAAEFLTWFSIGRPSAVSNATTLQSASTNCRPA